MTRERAPRASSARTGSGRPERSAWRRAASSASSACRSSASASSRAGAVGWDVASLEFRLRRFGLPAARDRRPLRRRDRGRPAALPALSWARARRRRRRPDVSRSRAREGEDGVRARHGGPSCTPCKPGEGFVVIARRYRIQPAVLARANDLTLRERAHAGAAAACPRPHRRRASCRAAASVPEHRPRPHRAAGRGLLPDRAPVRRTCHQARERQRAQADERADAGSAAAGPGSHRRRPEGTPRPSRSTTEARRRVRERASSRSPSATTSAHGGSRG